MRLAVLSSGSKGNALLVEHGKTALLVDCGLSPKRLRARMKMVGRQLADLDAIVLTHGHGDHAGGAARVAGPFKLRIYATRGTQQMRAKGGGLPNFVPVDDDVPFEIGDLKLYPFSVPHDARGTVGYVIEGGGARLGVLTDIGRPTRLAIDSLRGVDTLYIEYNHDPEMVKAGPYPPMLQRRVLGPLGHLSNEQAAEVTEACYTPRLCRLILAHLSETNNTPALALKAAKDALRGSGASLVIAPQHTALDFVDVARDPKAARERPPLPPPIATRKAPETVAAIAKPAHASVAVRRQLELFSGRS